MRFSIRLYEILLHSLRSAMFKSRTVNGANSAIRHPSFSRTFSIRFNLGKDVDLFNPCSPQGELYAFWRYHIFNKVSTITIAHKIRCEYHVWIILRKQRVFRSVLLSLLILFIITKLIFNAIFLGQA